MPLPFAPKPDESRVYQSLKSTLLSDVTADQLDELREDVFAQGIDGAEDEYRRLVLLALAANKAAYGPIETSFIVTTVTDNNLNVLTDIAEGEIWQLCSAAAYRSGGSGSSVYTMYLDNEAQTIGPGSGLGWFYLSSSDSNVMFSNDSNYFDSPIFLSKDMILAGTASGDIGTGVAWMFAVARVR
jgi:hypothetical protein